MDSKSHEGFGGQQVMWAWVGFWWTASHEGLGGVLLDSKSHEGFGGQQIMRVWVGFWRTASHMRVLVDSKTRGLGWVLVDSMS